MYCVVRPPQWPAGFTGHAVRANRRQYRTYHGSDADKQKSGGKRRITVDAEGRPLAVQVQSASVQELVRGLVLAEAPDLPLVWGDGCY